MIPYTQNIHLGTPCTEMDDGGCFFCAEEESQTIPLIGEELNEHCRMMCEADVDCVAYTVARPQGTTIFLKGA